MPRTCTICKHPDREPIERALLAGESYRNIAARFGTSASALVRHRADHLPASLVRAQAPRRYFGLIRYWTMFDTARIALNVFTMQRKQS
jgi:hypothetical protein